VELVAAVAVGEVGGGRRKVVSPSENWIKVDWIRLSKIITFNFLQSNSWHFQDDPLFQILFDVEYL